MAAHSRLEEGEGRAWPLHVRPWPDELCSSWMIRFAHAHGYKVEKMSAKLFGRDHALWTSDIDRTLSPEELAAFAAATATPIDRAMETTLQRFVSGGHLPGSDRPTGYSPWLLTLHLYHRNRRGPGLMYCPHCLRDGAYFRRRWRLAFVTVCEIHGSDMLDRCPKCSAAIAPHRVDIGTTGATPREGALARCWRCRFELSRASSAAAAPALLTLTRLLAQALDDGWIAWAGRSNLHAVPFFQGMRLLAREALRTIAKARAQLEDEPVPTRRIVMTILSEWMGDGAKHLGDRLREQGRVHNVLLAGRQPAPFWLVDALIPLKAPRVSEVPVRERTVVEPRHHEGLMSYLDQAIAAETDRRAKSALQQDKVMFSLFRFTRLSSTQLCQMQNSDMPPLPWRDSTDAAPACPSNGVEAIDALHRHVRLVRPSIPGAEGSPNTFVSAYRGKPMGKSGLQARFKKAVEAANLTAAIPGMDAYKCV